MNARTHRLRFNRHIIVLQFRYPYVIAIIEANEEKIRFSIFIDKQGAIDHLLASNHRFLLVLPERT